MSIDIYILYWNVTSISSCLVARVVSLSKVSIDVCVCVCARIYFGASFCVSNVKSCLKFVKSAYMGGGKWEKTHHLVETYLATYEFILLCFPPIYGPLEDLE
jgi:hypothetical protein